MVRGTCLFGRVRYGIEAVAMLVCVVAVQSVLFGWKFLEDTSEVDVVWMVVFVCHLSFVGGVILCLFRGQRCC